MASYTKGEFTYGNPAVHGLGYGNLKIGKFCSIAGGTNIILSGHRTDLFSTYPFGHSAETKDCFKNPELTVMGDVTIGNDVWTGENSIIIYGSMIGDGCVVAAGAVVKGRFKPYSLIAGNPAQNLFFRFDTKTIELLLKMKWWDWPYQIIREHIDVITSKDYNKLLNLYEQLKDKLNLL